MQVTGVLADALNWAGISEDKFNDKLAACTSESERNQLIMETLSETYDEASDAFYKNNASLVSARKNQALMDDTLAKLGETVSNVKNQLIGEFFPSISKIVSAFNDMITGVDGADQAFSSAVSELVGVAVQKLPEFLSFGAQIVTTILSGIVQALPSLVAQVPTIIGELVNALGAMLPQVASAGADILTMLGEGMRTGIPNMLAALPDVIMSLLDYITENLPAILAKGVEIVSSIGQGIIDGIPAFLERLPELITAFVDFITENLPQIIEAGITIAINLASGIIEAIPDIVKRLPEIIAAIAQGISDLALSIIEIGEDIVWYIIDGITSLTQDIIDMGEDINEWIIDGINNTIGDFFGIGEDMVRGILNGFESAAQTLLIPGASSTAGSVANAVKDKLGIHSPSTVFAEMGKNMALGLGNGWDGAFSSVRKGITDGMDFGTATVDFASSGLGISSAGIINSVASGGGEGWANGLTVNLTLPDGSKFATWQLPYLIKAGSAAGTPIAEAQRA